MEINRNYTIARVNLTDGTVRITQPETSALRQYLGGRGMGMHLLEESADESPLIFLTGPLTDGPVPPGGRYCAVTRSTDTGMPISLSSGTRWGAVLKRAGLDGIVIEGEAPGWTYLSIENGAVRFHSAQPYAGMLTGETVQALRAVCGQDCSVLSIGPAGENLVPISAILCDTDRAFSRGGIGRIMGAKKLKAIVVRAENAGEIPENACVRCIISCRHKNPGASEFITLCNAYGLDSVGAAQVIAAIGELQKCDTSENAAHWIREISRPATPLAKLAGEGLAVLRRTYGAELTPPTPKAPREKAKQNLPEEVSAVMDSMGCCLFAASAFGMDDYARMLTEATGEVFTPEGILCAGKQILQLEQRIANRQSSAHQQ